MFEKIKAKLALDKEYVKKKKYKTNQIVVADYKNPDGNGYHANLLLVVSEASIDTIKIIKYLNLNTNSVETVMFRKKPQNEFENEYTYGYSLETTNPDLILSSLNNLRPAYHGYRYDLDPSVLSAPELPFFVAEEDIPALTERVNRLEHFKKEMERNFLLAKRDRFDAVIQDMEQYRTEAPEVDKINTDAEVTQDL